MSEEIEILVSSNLMNTYRRYPVTLVRGQGMYLFDDEDNKYLDFSAGIAVVALGHSHPKVTEAVSSQISKLTHVSNLYYTAPMARLAERLTDLLGWNDGKVFFANSGAEANECAIKLIRKWSTTNFSPDRYETIATLGSFHGRTLETLAATGQPKKWQGFLPLPVGFKHVPYDDPAALEGAIDDKTAAVLLEPVQGEGGVVAPSLDYLPSVRKICDANAIAFVDDEVQTGLGRTGNWFGFQASGAEPDVITLAKALANGLPIGACVARGDFAQTFVPGDHATTMGGGPVVCAAALAVLDEIEEGSLVANARERGEELMKSLESLMADHPAVTEIRGEGLLRALEFQSPIARDVATLCLEKGLLVNDVLPTAIRLSPPLILESRDIKAAIDILDEVIAQFDQVAG